MYDDYIETPTGGFLPLITLIPMILKGIAVASLATSAISGVADTIINAVRGKGLTHIPINYKYSSTENNSQNNKNNNTNDFSYELGIPCSKCNFITETSAPHQIWVKEKGDIQFAGKCNICNSHKQVLLNDFQKGCIPDYITNGTPGAKYSNFIIDERSGAIVPISTSLFPIISGKSISNNSISNQQNISNSILRLQK